MKKILFLIHDLGHGGAEKVLVNLVNNMDAEKFDITVLSMFGGGVNEQFLKKHVRYITIFKKEFPGNSHFMKLFTPKFLHKWFIKDTYDIEVSYLEGPSARVISGCQNENTKLVSWIHCTFSDEKEFAASFRSKKEAKKCYGKFDVNAFVSKNVMERFTSICPLTKKTTVLYNVNQSEKILELSNEPLENECLAEDKIKICSVGRLIPVKGYDRLINIHKKLVEEGKSVNTYVLGEGAEHEKLQALIDNNGLADSFFLLGYQTNPYKYVAKCDLFVCSSFSEGFSTAATEALIVGTPVCTVEVSGMKEMLGENNEYGIVTENSEEALYESIKKLVDDASLLEHYRNQAVVRAKNFSTSATVAAVENMLLNL